jgi:hypothetical protein
MRKVTARSVLLSIGVSALVLVAASPPSLAKGAPAIAHTETPNLPISTMRAIGSGLIRPYGYARV